MINSYGKYQVHSGVLLVEAHDTSFYQATWATYEVGDDFPPPGRLVDGGTLPPHYSQAEEAMRAAQAHAEAIGKRLLGDDWGHRQAR